MRNPADDPDQDGLANFAEYALRTDPRVGSQAPLTIAYSVQTGAVNVIANLLALPSTEVTTILETATDTTAWQAYATRIGGGAWTLPQGSAPVSTSAIAGREAWSFVLPVSDQRRYFRLRFSTP